MMISLRETRVQELDFVLAAEQNQENAPFVIQWTRQQHESAIKNTDQSHLIIERKTDAKPVGYAILTGLENPDHSINLRRIVVVEKGKGYGKGALQLIQKLAFEQLNAHRLWLDVKECNLRARYLYEAVGFTFEGILREALLTGDNFDSLVVMSILRREYEASE